MTEPEKKTVTINVWDLETDEIIEMEIDQADLNAMDEASRQQKERLEEAYREEREVWQWISDDH